MNFGRIFSVASSRGLVGATGVGVVAMVIWYEGPMFAPLAPEINRIVLIVAIAVLYALYMLFKTWRNKKKTNAISKDLAASAETVDPNEAQSSEELATLKSTFDDALKALKKSSVGGKKVGSIYQLPWYIIIGPPGSGKTTLLVNSGLRFPLADKMGLSKVQGIGGTRNCDWWFTDEAVMIDTAGRYTTQDSNEQVDNKAWFGFLDLLKKHRRRRPINGIILAISMEELARQSNVERERNAAAISNRIQELYERLGIQFPIYLMFTKCDLMAGFMEFFGNLDRNDRAQVWGFTYGLKDDPIERFNEEFSILQNQLESRLVQRLQDERDVSRRELIYNFPSQLSATRDGIEEFLQRVFKPSRFTTKQLLRGIYFTSGTQEGTPFNRIMSQLAHSFSLSRSATQSTPSKGKSYFIQDLMTKLIFGESGIAGANMKVERIYGLAKKSGLAVLIALPILLNLAWWMSYSNNKEVAAEIDTAAENVEDTIKKVSPQSASMLAVLPLLNEARDMPLGYASRDDSVPISYRFGLSQSKRLGDNGTIPAYQRILENAFLPRLMVRMEQVLKESMNDPDQAYQVLKAYLMLANPDRMDTEFVAQWVRQDWDKTQSRVMSSEQLEQLNGHLDALLEMVPLTLPFDLDNNLVMTARDMLSRTTLGERIYAVIKSEHLNEGKAFTIPSAAGKDAARVFIRSSGLPINQGVPAFYTPEGYQQMYLASENRIITEMEDETWIFATEASGSEQFSQSELVNSIRRLYFKDYTDHWVDFLEDIRIRPFSSMAQAAEILQVLTDDDSPLRQLLVNVSNATRLAPEEKVADEGDDGTSLRDRISSIFKSESSDGSNTLLDPIIVDQSFASLHKLADSRDGAPSPLDNLLGDLQELYLYIDQLARSSSDQLLTGLQSQAGNAITRVRLRGERSPEPVGEWIMLIVKDSNNLVAGGAEATITAAWAADVLPFCRQALNGRYPFDSTAKNEVQLRDFGAFFMPGGTLDKFFDHYLADIVDTTASTWKLKPKVAGSLKVSAASLRQIQRAKTIQSAFFAAGGASPSISFELRPVRMDPVTTNFMLNINGQTTNYSHGPLFNQSFVWPGDSGMSQVQIQFSPLSSNGRSGMTLDGPWAFFRLLDTSGMTPSATPEKFQTKFQLDDRWVEYEIRANSAFNPFNLPELREFRCPSQL
ncbi:MAG: type VI secretion system membrane subunit TssM [Lysobacterales bacterium]